MPLDKEKQGMKVTDYKTLLENGTHQLRVGKEVPEGDVNLAYIHTPKVQSDENISLIDTSYTSDNVIPQDQLESIVVANSLGELEYVDILGNGEVQPRPPQDTFPSNKINITRKFKKNEIRTENALYYKFEIDYHYDSRKAIPQEDGTYASEKYSGQQIELTDENGNLLDDSYKYDIFVTPMEANPRIYRISVYLHKNTNEIDTIKIRYNHIDEVVKDEHVYSVQRSIEFYSNKSNSFLVDNKSKQMLEGGKLRIINGVSSFDESEEAAVREAMTEDNEKEIFAILPQQNSEGYKIIVPQKSEYDPRIPNIFAHRVVAEYKGSDEQTVRVSVGHITDWTLNPEALLKNERDDYSGDWKNIGMPAGGVKLNAKEMIEFSLPFGTPSIPSDANFFIEDDKGNLLYNLQNMSNNTSISTQINEVMSKAVEAKTLSKKQLPWTNAMQDNTVIKTSPIPHRCSIIPERQQTKWDFTWKANGQGYTEKTTNYKTNWQACADVAFKNTINPNSLDVLDKAKWGTIGNNADVNKWQYSYVAEMGKNVIEYLDNVEDIMGFYQKNEVINASTVNLMDKTDYQFSVKVRITDPVDDDAIGLMFRVRDAQNYYMFVWEKDNISTDTKTYSSDHGEGIIGTTVSPARIHLDEYGYTSHHYEPNGSSENWKYTKNKSTYLNSKGMGTKHKRIFKASPSAKAPHPNPTQEDTWNGSTRYPSDRTSCGFTDITDLATDYSAKGWEYGKDYKLTVVVTGELFRIYINENTDSDDLGQLVCQAIDNTHQKGSYGVFSASQRWTYWYDFKMTEITMDQVCTEKKDVILTDMTEKKLSNYTITDMLEPLIKEQASSSFEGAPYEVFEYLTKTDGEFTLRIDPINDFIYGRSNSSSAGEVVRSTWKTDENGLSVEGTGTVEYHADGHFTIVTNPTTLPSEQVPSDVLGFVWNKPTIESGENIAIELKEENKLKLTASVPPIRIIGQPYVLKDDVIKKNEEYKHMEFLFDTDSEKGFYDLLNIPDNIPKEEILLRIERGTIKGVGVDGSATIENPEHRVNYRFRCQKEGFTRLPVDQFQDQIGVNRIRLKSIMTDNDFDRSIKVDVIAWTTFEELEAVPLFAIKIEEQRKIEIEKPKVQQQEIESEGWYLRVKSGSFLKRMILPFHEVASQEKPPEIYVAYPQLLGMVKTPEEVVEVDLEYSLPEYSNQEFQHKPYVLIDKEKPIVLNEYAIQTSHSPIVLKSETNMSYLEAYSIRANQRRDLRISDVDAAKGIIYLHDRIREQDEVYIRYAYHENWYTYRGFQKNSTFMHLDLNPTPGHTHTIGTFLLHQWIPIVNSGEMFFPKEVPNTELLVKQIHVYLQPTVIRYVDHLNPAKHGKPISGTLRGRVLCHTDEEHWFNPKDYKYNPTLLRLGKVTLQANSNIKDNMTILDTRTRGGGLDDSLTKEIIQQVNKESLHHWDIGYFDGEAYQENGVIVVRVPRSVLKSDENPNGYHESEVQAAIAKHKGYGILPIIEYYDPKKELASFNLIPNYNFSDGKQIGYYNPGQSKGISEVIKNESNGEFNLKISNANEYGISIPGHRFKSNEYRLEVKALRSKNATDRSAGTVEVHLKNGTVKQIQLSQINSEQWMTINEQIEIVGDIHHVAIILNKSNDIRSGDAIYDHVSLIPTNNISEDTAEILEF